MFWLDPFVDKSRTKMCSIAGGPPLHSACLDAARKYALSQIQQQGVTQGKVSAAQVARLKSPHSFTTIGWNMATVDADLFDFSLQLVSVDVVQPCGAFTSL